MTLHLVSLNPGVTSTNTGERGSIDYSADYVSELSLSERRKTMGTILLIILVLLLIGALPTWGYSRSWGRGPSGVLGLVLVIVLALFLMGRI
jgi:hypothetical protein